MLKNGYCLTQMRWNDGGHNIQKTKCEELAAAFAEWVPTLCDSEHRAEQEKITQDIMSDHLSLVLEGAGKGCEEGAQNELPRFMKDFHGKDGGRVEGTMQVTHGGGILGRIVSFIAGFPSAARCAKVNVNVVRTGPKTDQFLWRRTFNGQPLKSIVAFRDGAMVETFTILGVIPISFAFHLQNLSNTGRAGFAHVTKQMWIAGIAIPKIFACTADGTSIALEEGDGWEVDVAVKVPLLETQLLSYKGKLHRSC